MFVFVIFLGGIALSKGSYEDAILQKLIKFENTMQHMNNEITSLKKQVKVLKENQRETGMSTIYC